MDGHPPRLQPRTRSRARPNHVTHRFADIVAHHYAHGLTNGVADQFTHRLSDVVSLTHVIPDCISHRYTDT